MRRPEIDAEGRSDPRDPTKHLMASGFPISITTGAPLMPCSNKISGVRCLCTAHEGISPHRIERDLFAGITLFAFAESARPFGNRTEDGELAGFASAGPQSAADSDVVDALVSFLVCAFRSLLHCFRRQRQSRA